MGKRFRGADVYGGSAISLTRDRIPGALVSTAKIMLEAKEKVHVGNVKEGALCRIERERTMAELIIAIRILSLEMGAMMGIKITGRARLVMYGTQVRRSAPQVI